MKIVYFQRKPIPNFHFSVEIIFTDVRDHLPADVNYSVKISRFFSRGFFPRLYNCLEAFFRQGEINHVTGDINYVGLFLSPSRTIHTILDCVFLQNCEGFKKYLLRLFWVRIPVRRSRFVTTISEASKAEIVMYSGCNPDKVKVIPIALSPIFKKVDRDYNWDTPRILIVGAAPNKNIPRILEALKGIACKVQIVGQFNENLKGYMDEHHMDYTFEWGLNPSQMYEKYQNTDMLVFASTYEGFGMPILEAQATGVPVVTSAISSMPEVAGQNGALFVDPYDVNSIREGILSLINDPQLRARIIENGFINVRKFKPEVISAGYLELYKQL